jgi:predicted nucleotidyltransferase
MSLNEIREGELKEVFSAIEQTFKAIGIDLYIIGAIARDVWYAKGNKSFRRTKDADFAVLVGSQEEYLALRKYLKEHYNFQDTKQNAFVMQQVYFNRIIHLECKTKVSFRSEMEGGV